MTVDISLARETAHLAIDALVYAYTRRHRLTPRESAVLRLIAVGYRYPDIAQVRGICVRTKVGVTTRAALVQSLFGEVETAP